MKSRKTAFLVFSFLLLFQGCHQDDPQLYEAGVSRKLAQMRKNQLKKVHYRLYLEIPENKTEPIGGTQSIIFDLSDAGNDLIIDFKGDEKSVHNLLLNGKEVSYMFANEHIAIDSRHLSKGENIVEIDFTSTDQALNRSDDFFYTLLVPDRASTAFPCFDQPDIKAMFSLTLSIPLSWEAISNGRQVYSTISGGKKAVIFASDKPISTYLMAFAAGVFNVETRQRDGREISIFHRETDDAKVERNLEEIFKLHFDAIHWLEDYTGIAYPFGKFDIALMPGFQYSGMEHPGAIWYRDSRLWLPADAPVAELVSRATLIAHETAHMWFGNLVTMEWFDDVWLKEVFAGFMADKIVKPSFPEVDHQMQFLLSHYPRAYSIDRTAGTHSIKQDLANMNLAGTLYGSIIYNKAPIAFQQLEWTMGEEAFQMAVREYLEKYSFGSADWSDLAGIFDKYTQADILGWSQAWIFGKGLPQFESEGFKDDNSKCGLSIRLRTSKNNAVFLPQKIFPAFFSCNHEKIGFLLNEPEKVFSFSRPDCFGNPLLPNGLGGGYGFFKPDLATRNFLLAEAPLLDDGYLKAVSFLTLHEDFLNRNISCHDYLNSLGKAILTTENSLLTKYLLANLGEAYWQFLPVEERLGAAKKIEKVLFQKLNKMPTTAKSQYLEAFTRISLSDWAQEVILTLLSETSKIEGLELSEEQKFWMVAQLFFLENPQSNSQLDKLLEETTNPDRRRRIEYLIPALSNDLSVRRQFFESLKVPENRRPEPWALDGLSIIHHPLRARSSLGLLPQTLDLVEEIQRTGDIFFPFNWLKTALSGHKSPEALKMVEVFLNNPKFTNKNLKLKTLQASDLLFRANPN